MKVHVLQHVPFEGIGSMEPWLASQGAAVSFTHLYENPTLPDPAGFDLIIVMGGPMSVNDEAALPWLVHEKKFLRTAMQQNVPVLGVCLGAQLIASALGARVYRAPQKEIGWFEVEAIPSATDAFRPPERIEAFHWHGETFDLPEGAVRLAQSAVCENQAFQVGRRVIALQFHPEMTSEGVEALAEHCSDELVEGGPTVQSAAVIRAAGPEVYARMNRIMAEVLSYLTGQ